MVTRGNLLLSLNDSYRRAATRGAVLLVTLLSFATSASAATLLEWRMNEGAGTSLADSSGNGRTGTMNGDLAALGDGTNWVSGHTGLPGDSAVHITQLVGPTPRISWVDAGNPLPMTQNGNFEVEVWMKAGGFAADEYVFSIGAAIGTTVALRADPSLTANATTLRKFAMTTINTGTGNYADHVIDITGNEVHAGTWQHIKLSYLETSPYVDSSTPGTSVVNFYVDGALAETIPLGYALSDTTEEVNLGSTPGNVWYRTFRGDLDNFKISSDGAVVPEPAAATLVLCVAFAFAAKRPCKRRQG